MDIATIFRELSRRRIYVAGVCVFAVLVGLAVEYRVPSFQSRSYQSGAATAFILVDTPSSQIVNVSPRGSDTTAARASLLASLMIDGEIKSIIAQRAGLQANKLVATTSAAINPAAGGGAATAAGPPASGSGSGSGSFALTTQVPTDASGNELPIIQLDTQAPTPAGAAKLANAAIAGVSAYLNTKAAGEGISDAQRLRVSGMGAPQATVETHGPTHMVVILVVFITFLLGCAGILGVQALVRGWRAAAGREQAGEEDPLNALEAVRGTEEPFARPAGAEEGFLGALGPEPESPQFPPVPRPDEPFRRLVRTSPVGSSKPGSDTGDPGDDWSPADYAIATEKDSFRNRFGRE
jgi:hypothetical protein